jgi:hypothetical protein
MTSFEEIGTTIIAIAMIWAVIRWINRERASENKKSMGCISTLIVIAGILFFWWLVMKI